MWDRLHKAGFVRTTKWPADRFEDLKPDLDSCFATLDTSIKASMKVDAILNPATTPSVHSEHADHSLFTPEGSLTTKNTDGRSTGASNDSFASQTLPSPDEHSRGSLLPNRVTSTGRRRVEGVVYKKRKSHSSQSRVTVSDPSFPDKGMVLRAATSSEAVDITPPIESMKYADEGSLSSTQPTRQFGSQESDRTHRDTIE